jgi:hypothetical protein
MNEGERLTAQQFQDSRDLEDWRVLAFGASAWFDAPTHSAGAALVHRVAARVVARTSICAPPAFTYVRSPTRCRP